MLFENGIHYGPVERDLAVRCDLMLFENGIHWVATTDETQNVVI